MNSGSSILKTPYFISISIWLTLLGAENEISWRAISGTWKNESVQVGGCVYKKIQDHSLSALYECDWARECVPLPRPIKTDICAARLEKSMTKKGHCRQQMRALLCGQSAKIIAPLVLQPSWIKWQTLRASSRLRKWTKMALANL